MFLTYVAGDLSTRRDLSIGFLVPQYGAARDSRRKDSRRRATRYRAPGDAILWSFRGTARTTHRTVPAAPTRWCLIQASRIMAGRRTRIWASEDSLQACGGIPSGSQSGRPPGEHIHRVWSRGREYPDSYAASSLKADRCRRWFPLYHDSEDRADHGNLGSLTHPFKLSDHT
jgi:hypothetical protein